MAFSISSTRTTICSSFTHCRTGENAQRQSTGSTNIVDSILEEVDQDEPVSAAFDSAWKREVSTTLTEHGLRLRTSENQAALDRAVNVQKYRQVDRNTRNVQRIMYKLDMPDVEDGEEDKENYKNQK